MTLFDRYLLREWFQIIFLVLAALVGLLLVALMYNELPKLLAWDASIVDVTMFFAVSVPSSLAILLPLTLLVSTLYVFGQMHRSHEFTALRAAGVSMFRISTPIWCVAVLCCGLSWWLNSGLVPWSVEQSRIIKERLRFKHEASVVSDDRIGAVSSVTFDNRAAGRLWFINRLSLYQQKAYGLSLSYLDVNRKETRRLVASSAEPLANNKGWVLHDGRDLVFDADSGDLIRNAPFQTLTCADLYEDPGLMLLIDRKPPDLSFWELQRLIAHLEEAKSPKIIKYSVRYHSLIAETIAPLIVVGLSIPFAVAGVRVNPAVGISKSIGLFALYYIFVQVASSLAVKGILDPVSAAWLPSGAMTLTGLLFFLRMR